jgi:hypothetical protein
MSLLSTSKAREFTAIPYRDPALHSNADPDPVSHNSADPLGGQIWVPWIKTSLARREGNGGRPCDVMPRKQISMTSPQFGFLIFLI